MYGKIKKPRKPYAFGVSYGAICGTRTLTGASTGGLYDRQKPYFSAFLIFGPCGCPSWKTQKSYIKSCTEIRKTPGRSCGTLGPFSQYGTERKWLNFNEVRHAGVPGVSCVGCMSKVVLDGINGDRGPVRDQGEDGAVCVRGAS